MYLHGNYVRNSARQGTNFALMRHQWRAPDLAKISKNPRPHHAWCVEGTKVKKEEVESSRIYVTKRVCPWAKSSQFPQGNFILMGSLLWQFSMRYYFIFYLLQKKITIGNYLLSMDKFDLLFYLHHSFVR